MLPNTGWVESLARFTFSIEYQKGWDNVATDALNWVTSKLDAWKPVKSILDGVTMGMMERADTWDPGVAKADEEICKQVQETVIMARTAQACINLHVTDWVTAQQEDPILKTGINWISNQKVQDLKHLLGDDTNTEEEKTILWEWKKKMLYQGALYHCHTPMDELEEALQFIVPTAHWIAVMNGCHWDAGHQDQQWTLYLLHELFWWPGMAAQMQKVISNWEWCVQHEGTHVKAPMQPIIVTAPLELLHVDFTSIETMMELDQPPNVVNLLVFVTTLWKMLWCMWPPIKLQRLLLSFCGKDISRYWEHWPSCWVTEEPTLKATSSESFASLLAGGRSSPNADVHDQEIK